ncbi:MAG: galactose mutarotase [Bacteroidaceae bacterium]|nr:galactose mutarotase [Bacteroidaceae bacterium]MBO5932794.1 galactose mutarotase [Bacteroidaceae bacterium]MBO5951360.1 galactose mutarotase [Bacteroidaceae bacterium]MBQ5573206.1 galactose mutarotase [Bacteroidaceae bacterium]MBR4302041.1 galactose mutarotase [Bacteroidaceae bacterium]
MMNSFYVENNLSGLKREDFQGTIQGKATDLYILKNKNGCEIAATNFAGALLSIMMPDREGKMASVVMGHDSLENVMNSKEEFLSTLIGRYGNRIAAGKFTLDGKQYSVALNNGVNHLHGGPTGFHKRVWDAEQLDQQTLKLHYTAADGEEGFPGTLNIDVTYKLTDSNEFVIEYEATTDKKTILNLTQHAYFNLNGMRKDTPSVLDYELTLNADHYIPIDETAIPLGTIDSVEGTAFDFRTPHKVGERIEGSQQTANGNGYDHCWVLNKREPGELSFAAKCYDAESGRFLECYTTEPGVQVYSGNYCSGSTCAHGSTLPKRCAICFEAQHFPDSPNRPYFPSTVLNPGEVYTQTTIYRFGVE